MSAQRNKMLLQELFDAIAAGNRKPFLDAVADDVTMRVTGRNSWSRTYQGKAALERELYAHLRTLLVEPRRTIAHNFIADGDYVAVEARGDMITKAGAPYNNEYCLVYRVENGKITEFREYCDSALTESVLGAFPASTADR